MSTEHSDALIKAAESLEKLANSLEEQEKTARVYQADPDFGSLASNSHTDADPLTSFLLS